MRRAPYLEGLELVAWPNVIKRVTDQATSEWSVVTFRQIGSSSPANGVTTTVYMSLT